MKRGPKPFIAGCGRTMPLHEIAQHLGVSVRTVEYDLKSALRKLRRHPQAYSLIVDRIYAVAIEGRSIPACGSVECDRDFIALNGEVF